MALKAGLSILLMGTPGETRGEPAEKVKFAEDMAEAEVAAAVRACVWFFFCFFCFHFLNTPPSLERAAAGPGQPGQHLLHERVPAVPAPRA